MKRSPLLLILTAVLTLASSALAAPDPDFHIYLCFGQSNMESGGKMEDMDKTVDKRFQVMADADSTNRGWKKGIWYEAVPPLTAKGNGICLVDYFGRTMVAGLPEKIRVGVIKVSVPGARIEMFEKNTYTNYAATAADWTKNHIKRYDSNPYQHLVEMAREAQKQGVIKGILLHQGESNVNDKARPGLRCPVQDVLALIRRASRKVTDYVLKVTVRTGQKASNEPSGSADAIEREPRG